MDADLWNIRDDDEGEDSLVKSTPAALTCLVLLVDVSPEMFDEVANDDGGEPITPMRRVMEAIYNMLCQKCIGGEQQYTSLIFVNSDTSNVDGQKQHLFEWHKCSLPTKEMTKAVRNVMTSKDIRKSIGAICGCDSDLRADWSDAFWLAARTLNGDRKYGSKRVVVFTVDELPHRGDAAAQARITGKLKALHDTDCTVLVIHPLGRDHFDRSIFWAAAQSQLGKDQMDDQAEESLDEWLSSVRRKDVKKRSLGNVDFTLGDGVVFSLNIYNMIQTALKPPPVWLDSQRNEECRTKTTYFNEFGGTLAQSRPPAILSPSSNVQVAGGERSSTSSSTESPTTSPALPMSTSWNQARRGGLLDGVSSRFLAMMNARRRPPVVIGERRIGETGEKLIDRDMHKYQTFAGQRISLDFEEVEGLRRMMNSGMRLLGFKPISVVLNEANFIRSAMYIFPDNTSVRGSGELYAALLRRCLDRQVAAICSIVPRSNMPPRMVALLPRDTVHDDEDRVETHPAFHVIHLPFADDIRDLSKLTQQVDKWPQPTETQTTLADNMVESLMWKSYHPEAIDNPALQRHYRGVEAMAMDIADYKPEDVKDATKPDNERITKRAGTHLDEFIAESFPVGYDAGRVESGSKKPRKAPTDGPPVDLRKECAAKKLTKLTVVVLKAEAAKNKIKIKATKKADIIAEIEKWFASH